MTTTRRPCPVCDSLDERRLVYRQHFVGETAVGSGYDVAVCDNCGAGFADGIPSQVELDRYYAEASKYEYGHSGGAESLYDTARFETIADQIAAACPDREIRILDVGCATGGLLASLARRGYTKLLGSDPSPMCTLTAHRLYGIETVTATIAQHAGWSRQFDLIILVGVLEHVREVRGAIAVLRERLAPGGIIYCAQPDADAFTECVNAPFQQFSTEHINFFTVDSLNRLMRECGLAPVRTCRWLLEWREGITDSAVSGTYVRHGSPRTDGDHLRPDGTLEALRRYVAQCRETETVLREKVGEFISSQEPLLIWGAGTLTRRLLASAEFSRMNIVGFIDSNPHVIGTTLAGRTVLAPEDVKGHREKILICSKAFEREIEATIRHVLGLGNLVAFLCSSDPS